MLPLAVKVFALACLVRLLMTTDKPWLCAGIYAGVALVLGLVFGGGWVSTLVSAGLGFLIAAVYFWVLDRLDTGSVGWWLVAVLGMPMVFL